MPEAKPEQSPVGDTDRFKNAAEAGAERDEANLESRSENELNRDIGETAQQYKNQAQGVMARTKEGAKAFFGSLREKLRSSKSGEKMEQQIGQLEAEEQAALAEAEGSFNREVATITGADEPSVIIDDSETRQAMEMEQPSVIIDDEVTRQAMEDTEAGYEPVDQEDIIIDGPPPLPKKEVTPPELDRAIEQLGETVETEAAQAEARRAAAEAIDPAELDMEMQELGLAEGSDIEAEIQKAEQRLAELNPPAIEPADTALAEITRKLKQERTALEASAGYAEQVGDSTYQGSRGQTEMARQTMEDSRIYVHQLEQQQKNRLTERLGEIGNEAATAQSELDNIAARKSSGTGWEKDLGFDSPLAATKHEAELKRQLKNLEQEQAQLETMSIEIGGGSTDERLVEIEKQLTKKESDLAAIDGYLNGDLKREDLPSHLQENLASNGSLGLKQERNFIARDAEKLHTQKAERTAELERNEAARQQEIADLTERTARLKDYQEKFALRAELDDYLTEQALHNKAKKIPDQPLPEHAPTEQSPVKKSVEAMAKSAEAQPKSKKESAVATTGGNYRSSRRKNFGGGGGTYYETKRTGKNTTETRKKQGGIVRDIKQIFGGISDMVTNFFKGFK